MTLPTPDAQSHRSLSPHLHAVSDTHSIPASLSLPSTPPLSAAAFPSSGTDLSRTPASPSADFSHSWDLATGGLKTLTAKRELPPRQQRRGNAPPPELAPTRSYMFLLVILACVVVMLISGGVVLFMTLQP